MARETLAEALNRRRGFRHGMAKWNMAVAATVALIGPGERIGLESRRMAAQSSKLSGAHAVDVQHLRLGYATSGKGLFCFTACASCVSRRNTVACPEAHR